MTHESQAPGPDTGALQRPAALGLLDLEPLFQQGAEEEPQARGEDEGEVMLLGLLALLQERSGSKT